MSSSIFDCVLDLEDQFYTTGFQQGHADGVLAGRISGRTFGLEKGFEKYAESSKIYGKSLVWANRLPRHLEAKIGISSPKSESSEVLRGVENVKGTENVDAQGKKEGVRDDIEGKESKLPSLPENERLARHIRVLHALSESASLKTENNEDAVAELDDRVKRAQAKIKLVERILGEGQGGPGAHGKEAGVVKYMTM